MAWKDDNNKWHTENEIPVTETTVGKIATGVEDEETRKVSGKGIHTLPASIMSVYELDGQGGPLIVKVNSMKPPKLGQAFNLSLDDVLIVPVGAVEAYKSDPVWGKFCCIRESKNLKPGAVEVSNSDELRARVEALEEEVEKMKEVIRDLVMQGK